MEDAWAASHTEDRYLEKAIQGSVMYFLTNYDSGEKAEIHKDFPNLPLYFNYSSNLKWHEAPSKFHEIAELGYKVMHVSLPGLRVIMQATWDYAVDLMNRGADAEIDFQKRLITHPMGAFNELSGFPKIKELEKKYLPADEISKRYDSSLGL